MILNPVVIVEEVIRHGKRREENKPKICTGSSHSFLLPSPKIITSIFPQKIGM